MPRSQEHIIRGLAWYPPLALTEPYYTLREEITNAFSKFPGYLIVTTICRVQACRRLRSRNIVETASYDRTALSQEAGAGRREFETPP